MSEAIIMEVRFFLISFWYGFFLFAIYDCIRILRRIINHWGCFVALEDLLFWIISGVCVFQMMYQQNNGIIRSFSIGGILLGMFLYHNVLSPLLVEQVTKVIQWILKIVWKITHFLTAPFSWFLKRVKWVLSFLCKKGIKAFKYLLKGLKKMFKTVTISVKKK